MIFVHILNMYLTYVRLISCKTLYVHINKINYISVYSGMVIAIIL